MEGILKVKPSKRWLQRRRRRKRIMKKVNYLNRRQMVSSLTTGDEICDELCTCCCDAVGPLCRDQRDEGDPGGTGVQPKVTISGSTCVCSSGTINGTYAHLGGFSWDDFSDVSAGDCELGFLIFPANVAVFLTCDLDLDPLNEGDPRAWILEVRTYSFDASNDFGFEAAGMTGFLTISTSEFTLVDAVPNPILTGGPFTVTVTQDFDPGGDPDQTVDDCTLDVTFG